MVDTRCLAKQLEAARQKKKDSPSTRRENESVQTEVQRLEVSPAKDMAWEFSKARLEFDEGGKHSAFDTYIMRVWKKVNGNWRIAAMMVRPVEAAR